MRVKTCLQWGRWQACHAWPLARSTGWRPSSDEPAERAWQHAWLCASGRSCGYPGAGPARRWRGTHGSDRGRCSGLRRRPIAG